MSESPQSVGVCLLGCGTVGGGVVSVLTQQRALLKQRTGIDFVLRHVVVKSREEYPPNHAELPMSLDANGAIDDPNSNVIVELIGGTGVAFTFVERALKLGKPVITANKALLAVKDRSCSSLRGRRTPRSHSKPPPAAGSRSSTSSSAA